MTRCSPTAPSPTPHFEIPRLGCAIAQTAEPDEDEGARRARSEGWEWAHLAVCRPVLSSENSLQNGGHDAAVERLLIAQTTADWHDMEVVIGFSGSALASLRVSKIAMLAALGIWAGAFAACSGGEPPPYVPPKGAGGDSGLGGAAGAHSGSRPQCREGAQKECSVEVVLANGIKSCWYGTKYCVDERWTECINGGDPSTQGER